MCPVSCICNKYARGYQQLFPGSLGVRSMEVLPRKVNFKTNYLLFFRAKFRVMKYSGLENEFNLLKFFKMSLRPMQLNSFFFCYSFKLGKPLAQVLYLRK